MLHPESMPAATAAPPIGEADTSCLGFFSRRVGLISICVTLLVMSALRFFTLIAYMTVVRGGILAIYIIYFFVNLADGGFSGLLLLGIRDGVVRARLNMWLIWTAVYTVVYLLLVIIDLCVAPITAGLGVLSGLELVLMITLRVYCLWAGWKYREELMAAPPPAAQHRPDMGHF